MISSLHRLEPPLFMEVAPEQEKAPERESRTFYIVTGILALSAALLAVLSLVAVVVVFSGGVS